MKTPRPVDEEARIRELDRYPLFAPEENALFSDITRLLANILGTETARISIVDTDHEWAISPYGKTDYARARDHSFCARGITRPEELFIVPDAQKDPRFKDFPQVQNGEVRFYAGAPLVTPAGHTIGMLCVTDRRPKTLTKQQQDALQTLARHTLRLLELQTLLGETTQEQKALQKRIKDHDDADARRMDAMGAVFHDLAAPVTVMRIQLRLLRTKAVGSNHDFDKRISVIENSLDQLDHLTKDLNLIIRSENKRIPVQQEEIDLDDIIQEAERAQRPIAEQYDIDLTIDTQDDIHVTADPYRLTQILSNLLSNAIKFTPDEGKITITTHTQDDHAQISITDTGRGIEENEIPLLFRPFAQFHKPHEARTTGSGLGLPITKRLVEAQGGKIWAESKGKGKGSTFTFTLPLVKEDTKEREEQEKDLEKAV